MKTHQIGYAYYIRAKDWPPADTYAVRVRQKLHFMAWMVWLKSPNDIKIITHPPGSAFLDPIDFIGSVGARVHLEHRWPSVLGHLLLTIVNIRSINLNWMRGHKFT